MSGVGQIGGVAGGGAPSGAAGGDLSGTYPNPGVAKLNGVAAASYALASALPAADPVAGTAGTRTLGLTGNKAMPGTATLDQIANPVADRSFGGFKATLLGRPTVATDADVFGLDNDAYVMKQRGFLAEAFPLASANNAIIGVTQSLYQIKVWLPYTISVTGIAIIVQTAGATLTSAQNLCTLYDSAGTLKGSTADQSAVWNAAGAYAMALGGGPYSMTGGDGAYCWVTILANGTTPPSFSSGPHRLAYTATPAGTPTGVNLMCGRNGTAVTAPPSPLVPANQVITSATAYWVGLY